MDNRKIRSPKGIIVLAGVIIFIAVLNVASTVHVVGKYNLWNKDVIPLVIISLFISFLLMAIGIGMIMGRNRARQFWLWLWFPFLWGWHSLIKAITGTYPELPFTLSLLTFIWIISLIYLNQRDIKAYFLQRSSLDAKTDKEEFEEIDENLVSRIRKNMEAKQTDELVEILKQNDRTQYTKEAFEAISQILKERGEAKKSTEHQ